MAISLYYNYLPVDVFLQQGDICVAKSEQFDSYYRAEIIDFRDSKDVLIDTIVVRKKNTKTVNVFFIYYGMLFIY